MLEWLTQFGDFLSLVVNGMISVIRSFFTFLGMLPQWTTYLSAAASYAPSVLNTFIVAGIFISIILLIVGRN